MTRRFGNRDLPKPPRDRAPFRIIPPSRPRGYRNAILENARPRINHPFNMRVSRADGT